MADKVNLFVDQGTDFEVRFLVSYSNNTLVNLSDYNAFGSLRKYYTSNAQINMTVERDTANSILIAKIPQNISASLDGRYVYDIKLLGTGEDGKIIRIVEGIMTIMPEVTKEMYEPE